MFIGRKSELQFLNERYQSKNAEFITLYGRRRVGKTELLTEFCKGKPTVFYACTECTNNKQLSKFSDVLFDYDNELRKRYRSFSGWEQVFSHLPDLISDEKLIIVIDEFPYMARGDRSIPSVLQNLWDHAFSHENIMIILSGSSISFMEDEILSAKNPLYGRMTGIYKLEPLPFDDAVQFFPNYSNEDKVITYSILGGIPHYLKQFDPSLSLEGNIKRFILTKGSILFNEVEYILHQELREPAAYNTILEAIALGNNRYNEICEKAQMDNNNVFSYLKGLMELGLVAHEFPILSSAKEMVKRSQGEYKIADNFFRFWYSYAFPYISELAQGETENIWSLIIKDDLHHFASLSFEKVSVSYLRKLNRKRETPFTFLKIGRYWGKTTIRDNGKPFTAPVEIDILATDKEEKNYLLGECKFRNEPFDQSQLKKFSEKLNLSGNVYYYLFSLSGFTDAVTEEAAKNKNLILVPFDELFNK